MSQLSYWYIKWVYPSAVVAAAMELGRGDVVKGLRIIAERGEPWMRNMALELLNARSDLEEILANLKAGMAVDKRLVDEITKKVKNSD